MLLLSFTRRQVLLKDEYMSEVILKIKRFFGFYNYTPRTVVREDLFTKVTIYDNDEFITKWFYFVPNQGWLDSEFKRVGTSESLKLRDCLLFSRDDQELSIAIQAIREAQNRDIKKI